MDKTVIAIGAITFIILASIIGLSVNGSKNFKAYNQCVEHSAGLSMHIHPELEIYVNNEHVTIPANIGIDPTCMKAIHTHDDTGKIHLEYPEQYDFKLGDFFTVWGKSFNKNQLLDKTVDDTHTLTMTVDGQPSTEFENLIMKDGQKIVIRYDEKK